jgi:hypothetical protein
MGSDGGRVRVVFLCFPGESDFPAFSWKEAARTGERAVRHTTRGHRCVLVPLLQGPKGTIQWGPQLSYVDRNSWSAPVVLRTRSNLWFSPRSVTSSPNGGVRWPESICCWSSVNGCFPPNLWLAKALGWPEDFSIGAREKARLAYDLGKVTYVDRN